MKNFRLLLLCLAVVCTFFAAVYRARPWTLQPSPKWPSTHDVFGGMPAPAWPEKSH